MPAPSDARDDSASPVAGGQARAIPAARRILALAADRTVKRRLKEILEGTACQLTFLARPEELWEMPFPACPTCLLCTHLLPDGRTGFDVLGGIHSREMLLPTAIMTEDWEPGLAVRFMKAGACDFLKLPIDREALRLCVEQALQESARHWAQASAIAGAKALAATLRKREREVIRLLLKGCLNKEIADQLNLALVTIKVHRASAMKKLGAGNASEMVRIATLAGMCDEEQAARTA